MKSATILIGITLLFGCQKFQHSEITAANCELCPYAQTLEGTYRGIAYNSWYGPDSATVTVQQVFLGNSAYEDSVFMYFNIELEYDSIPYGPTKSSDLIRINSDDGLTVADGQPSQHMVEILRADSIVLLDQFWGGSNGYITSMSGTFYRQ